MSTGILDLYFTNTSGYMVLNNYIPKQTIKLVSLRIQYTTAGNSAASRFLKLQTPFFRGNSFQSGNDDSNTTYINVENEGIILYCDNQAVTILGCGPLFLTGSTSHVNIELSNDIPMGFPYTITSLSAANTGFSSLHLIFEYKTQNLLT